MSQSLMIKINDLNNYNWSVVYFVSKIQFLLNRGCKGTLVGKSLRSLVKTQLESILRCGKNRKKILHKKEVYFPIFCQRKTGGINFFCHGVINKNI